MTMTRHSHRTRRPIAVLSLLLTVVAMVLGTAPSYSAESDWWTPAARPAPDSQINVTGEPFKGTDSQGQVRGFVDAHNHLMSNEAFGGRLICGQTFSERGIADALKDCPEHYPDGSLAVFDFITKGATAGTTPTDGRRSMTGPPMTR